MGGGEGAGGGVVFGEGGGEVMVEGAEAGVEPGSRKIRWRISMFRVLRLVAGVALLWGMSGCAWSVTQNFWNRSEHYTMAEEGKVHRFSTVELYRLSVYGLYADASGFDGIILYEGAAPRNISDARRMYGYMPAWRTLGLKRGDTGDVSWRSGLA